MKVGIGYKLIKVMKIHDLNEYNNKYLKLRKIVKKIENDEIFRSNSLVVLLRSGVSSEQIKTNCHIYEIT